MAHQTGIDIRRDNSGALIIPALLLDSSGAVVTTGTTSVYILELQEDGSFKTLDFNDNTFKATACTTPTASATHRAADNATKDTGIWTVILSDAQQANFTEGNQYIAYFENSGASPTMSPRWFQWGGVEGAAATEVELAAAHGDGDWDAVTSAPTVEQIDTYLTAMHGTGSWQTGVWGGSGANAVTITLVDGDGATVGSQLCIVRNSDETSILAFGFTNGSGQVAFNLDDGSYKVRWGGYWGVIAGGTGVYSFSNPYTLTVSGNTTATHTCAVRSLFTGGLSFAEMVGMVDIFVRNNFKPEVANRFSRELMKQLVNTGYQDLGQKIAWRRDEVSVDIAADDYQYDVSLASRQWDLVEYYDDSSEVYKILRAVDLVKWRELMIEDDESGVPEVYARYGDQIYLHPVPDDADDTLTIHGIVDVAELTLDDEHPEFPPHQHPLIVDMAIARAWRLAGNAQMGDLTEAAADRQVAAERSEDVIRRTSGRIRPPRF